MTQPTVWYRTGTKFSTLIDESLEIPSLNRPGSYSYSSKNDPNSMDYCPWESYHKNPSISPVTAIESLDKPNLMPDVPSCNTSKSYESTWNSVKSSTVNTDTSPWADVFSNHPTPAKANTVSPQINHGHSASSPSYIGDRDSKGLDPSATPWEPAAHPELEAANKSTPVPPAPIPPQQPLKADPDANLLKKQVPFTDLAPSLEPPSEEPPSKPANPIVQFVLRHDTFLDKLVPDDEKISGTPRNVRAEAFLKAQVSQAYHTLPVIGLHAICPALAINVAWYAGLVFGYGLILSPAMIGIGLFVSALTGYTSFRMKVHRSDQFEALTCFREIDKLHKDIQAQAIAAEKSATRLSTLLDKLIPPASTDPMASTRPSSAS